MFTRIKDHHLFLKATNVTLRIIPMCAKFLLILYMGRFFELEEVGLYGLVAGTIILFTVFLGQKLDYIVMREIVTASKKEKVILTRDQLLYFGINYALLGFGLLIFSLSGLSDIQDKYLAYIFILTVLEGYGTIFCYNMISMRKQLLANAIILIRSGLWIIPVLILGLINPDYRNIDTVLIGWCLGGVCALATTLWVWRNWPWQELFQTPVNWKWIKTSVKKSSLIWIGGIGIACGVYLDRFVVAHFLNLEMVGVLTLFFSFTNTICTLMESGVIAFAYPKLVSHHKAKDHTAFNKESKSMAIQLAIGAGGMVFALGLIAPFFGVLFDKPAVETEIYTFVLMLVGTWLRVNAETPYVMLFARHEDRPIWLGNLLFLVPALGFNILLVPIFGLSGIGYSTILSGLFLLAWRSYYAKSYKLLSLVVDPK